MRTERKNSCLAFAPLTLVVGLFSMDAPCSLHAAGCCNKELYLCRNEHLKPNNHLIDPGSN